MSTVHASCLCGAVAWEADGPLEFMSHCHCGRCRKAHGAAFATYVMCPPEAFRLVRGADAIGRVEAASGLTRAFCTRCGSVVTDGRPWQGLVGFPAGPLDDDPGVRPLAHIFVASKAPWDTIADDLPRFDAFPGSVGVAPLADLAPRDPDTGRPRGSCLCGDVAYVVEGLPLRVYNCHCGRCRKARGAAFATNLFTSADGVRFTRGEDRIALFRLPGAQFFAQAFCRGCGSPMPRIEPARGLAIVPMGGLDDDPGARPDRHIFTASKAPWYEIADDLPQYAERAPTL